MQTLLEILRKTTAFLANKGLPNARRESELLIAATLNCKRLDLYLQFERPMSEANLEQLRDRVRRRAAREPLQYITGSTDFRELTLACDRRALIPRPETEELVGHVLAALPADATRIADLGTGTGAIALSLARERDGTQLAATDISTDALALARENTRKNGLESRIEFYQGDWLRALPGDAPFDAIVSNPPYLTEAELGTAEPEVARHEPREALVSADAGAADLKRILADALHRLSPNGFVALETGIEHSATLAAHAQSLGYPRHETRKDLSNRDRFFLAWKT